jgi:hypothetical protein
MKLSKRVLALVLLAFAAVGWAQDTKPEAALALAMEKAQAEFCRALPEYGSISYETKDVLRAELKKLEPTELWKRRSVINELASMIRERNLEMQTVAQLTIKTGEKPEVVGLPKDRNVWYFGKFKDGDEEVWFVIHTPSREVRGWTETDCMVNMGPADNLTPKHVSDVATFRDGGSATIEVYDYKGWGKRTFDFPFQTFNEEGKPNVWTFDKMPVWEYTHRHTPDGVNGLTWEEWKKIERR